MTPLQILLGSMKPSWKMTLEANEDLHHPENDSEANKKKSQTRVWTSKNHGTLTISYHDHNQSDYITDVCFITTDEYENVQDEKEEVKSNSIWLSMKNHDSECPKMSYENKFKRQLILLHPGSILLQNRRTLPE